MYFDWRALWAGRMMLAVFSLVIKTGIYCKGISVGSYGLGGCRLMVVVGALAVLNLGGCADTRALSDSALATRAALQAGPAQGDYLISSGDELELKFFYVPDMNTDVKVRPDGKINLPLIGDVSADGFTTTELAEHLKKSYADVLKRPDVSINIRDGFANQRVFVGGEVAHPGMLPLQSGMTVLQAILSAEGFKDSAKSSKVLILRRGPKNTRQTLVVNAEAALKGTDLQQDIFLRPYDTIIVPKTGVANVNEWVDLYIRRNIPISLGFTYIIDHNASSTATVSKP